MADVGAMGDGIAIVGMGALFPGAPDLDAYWANIAGGVDAISEVPAERWEPFFYDPESFHAANPPPDRVYCRRGGFVDEWATFDPAAFGIMPVTVEAAEPDQLLALKVAAAAIADAGGEGALGDPGKVGVIVGRGGYFTTGMARFDQRVRVAQQLVESLRELVPGLAESQLDEVKRAFQDQLGPVRPEAAIDLVPNLAASRIANRLDLQGPAYTVDAAGASSLVAVDQAVNELRSGRCDAVVAGGVHHCHDVAFWTVFAQLRALSPSERIRPFDRSADGLLIGEGTGMVVLKRLADAERDGDRVYAVIRGTGVASDGRASSVMKPRVDGQLLALERAWTAAGLDPDTVGLIEAHGTATPVGDAAELDTLARFFGPARGAAPAGDESRAVLGSVKSMIGHTMPAAGAAALIKAALAVHHGVRPPTLHCDEPQERLAEGRFRTLAVAEPWPADDERRRAGVNAFGFGGINAHVVLEAPPTARPSAAPLSVPTPTQTVPAPDFGARAPKSGASSEEPVGRERVVLLAGASADDLLAQLDDPTILTSRDDSGAPPSADPARPWRLALVAPDERRLELARKVVARGTPWRGRNDVWFSPEGLLSTGGKLAFVFPGVEPDFTPRVDDVAAHFGLPLGPLEHAEGEDLHLGLQGAGIIALGRLLDASLAELGVRPDLVAGHSIGEWNAMIAAHLIPDADIDAFIDSIDTDDVDVPGVVFAALGCGADHAAAVLGDRTDVVVSHDNCPHQSIICGSEAGVAEVIDTLRAERVLAQELPFRSGFHSPMLDPYVEPVRAATARVPLQAPVVPVWSATTVAPYPDDDADVRELVIRHLLEPVRFRELALRLHDEGVRVFVQVGQGSLVNFLDDTLKGREHLSVTAAGPRHEGLDQLRRVAAALWAEGAAPRFERLAPPAAAESVDQAGEGAAAGSIAARATAASATSGARLPLGAPLVHLDPDVRLPLSAGAGDVAALLGDVGDLAAHPVLAEFEAALAEVAPATADVVGAWRTAGPTGAGGTVVPGAAVPPPPAAEPTPAADEPASLTEVRTMSMADMPFLIDHRFYRQRDDWEEVSDLFPVVPMTCTLQLFQEVASRLMPGKVPIGLESVRALRWLAVEPPIDVTVTAAVTGPDRVRVSVEGFSRGTVVFADEYPEPPDPDAEPLADAGIWGPTAWDLYHDRWAFHGPQYQGVREIGLIGPTGVQGTIEALAAPGALLDGAGQLVGHWVAMHTEVDRLALPSMIERIRFFGPHPPAGDRFDCTVRVNELTDAFVRADLELVSARPEDAGRLWCRIDGWQDTRFDTDEVVFPMLRDPDRLVIAERRPGGWSLATEHWDNSASRELMMRRYLNHRERPTYEAQNPKAQRQWFLGRVAAKDAVRSWLWDHGAGPLFPAEITVLNDDEGRPVVEGPGCDGLRVSLAHTEWAAVAVVAGPGEPDPGIDVEADGPRHERFASLTLADAERTLVPADEGPERDLALTRLWTVKEAAGKAAGTGLQGRPKDLVVTALDETTATVGGRTVSTEVVPVGEGDTARRYVVSWTTPDADGATT